MNTEDELRGIIEIQELEVKQLKAENKRLKEQVEYSADVAVGAIEDSVNYSAESTRLKEERKRYKDCLEFLLVTHVNDRVKTQCIKRTLKGT